MSLGKLQEMERTGRPGVLQSMAWQRFGHDWVSKQQGQQESGRMELNILTVLSKAFKTVIIDWISSHNIHVRRLGKGIPTTYLLESGTPIRVLHHKQKALDS